MNLLKRGTVKEAKKSENISQVQGPKAALDKKQKAEQKEDPVGKNIRSPKKGVSV